MAADSVLRTVENAAGSGKAAVRQAAGPKKRRPRKPTKKTVKRTRQKSQTGRKKDRRQSALCHQNRHQKAQGIQAPLAINSRFAQQNRWGRNSIRVFPCTNKIRPLRPQLTQPPESPRDFIAREAATFATSRARSLPSCSHRRRSPRAGRNGHCARQIHCDQDDLCPPPCRRRIPGRRWRMHASASSRALKR